MRYHKRFVVARKPYFVDADHAGRADAVNADTSDLGAACTRRLHNFGLRTLHTARIRDEFGSRKRGA
jgi:hypothetical protein